MSYVTMMLGPHIFYVPQPGFDTPSFDTIDRDTSFTLPSQGRLSRDPAMQFTGPGEDVLTIQGKLFPHHFGGLTTVEGLRESGRAGQPLTLIRWLPLLKQGNIVGKFMIRRVRENQSKIGITGVAHKTDFTLELVRYGDDRITDTMPDGEFLFS